MMSGAKELYASVDTRANTTIKQEEELVVHIRTVVERERAVEELEQRLLEREGLDNIKLGRELEALATRESNLDDREATPKAEQKALEDARLTVMARELAADVREADRDTRAAELADKEKRLAERQTQELAATQKRLEEQRVWDFLGYTEAALVPFSFSPLRSGLPT
jgi:hypothetical protein